MFLLVFIKYILLDLNNYNNNNKSNSKITILLSNYTVC